MGARQRLPSTTAAMAATWAPRLPLVSLNTLNQGWRHPEMDKPITASFRSSSEDRLDHVAIDIREAIIASVVVIR